MNGAAAVLISWYKISSLIVICFQRIFDLYLRHADVWIVTAENSYRVDLQRRFRSHANCHIGYVEKLNSSVEYEIKIIPHNSRRVYNGGSRTIRSRCRNNYDECFQFSYFI